MALGWTVQDLANILGTSSATIYRKEAAPENPAHLSDLQDVIVGILGAHQQDSDWAAEIRRAIPARGAAYALYLVLSSQYAPTGN